MIPEERQHSADKPTVGRIVWFWQAEPFARNVESRVQPYRAEVIYVHVDGNARLKVTDHHGNTFVEDDMPIFDPIGISVGNGDCHGSGQDYATWMPYQKKQHDKQKEQA